MRIYTAAGDLAFKTFTFPDGQPHFQLETYERELRSVTIETAIRNPAELFQVLLVADVLRRQGYNECSLDVRYLLGARMDRALDPTQPFSLDVISRLINGAGFSRVRLLDVHSEVATRLLRNSTNVLPHKAFDQVWTTLGPGDTVAVTPDKGADSRVRALLRDWQYRYCTMMKVRDPATGNLKGFCFGDGRDNVKGFDCLIIDDLCDGGATFVGEAKLLRQMGAKRVCLYVTHGIFSKGLSLEGIDHIYTTDSYLTPAYENLVKRLTVIPIRMQDLKD